MDLHRSRYLAYGQGRNTYDESTTSREDEMVIVVPEKVAVV